MKLKYSSDPSASVFRILTLKMQLYAAACQLLLQDPLRKEFFLSPAEETTIRRYYEEQLITFCRDFSPPMPMYVMVRI